MKSALERFNEKYVVNEETGCWEWTASLTEGYGRFHFRGAWVRAHRFAWTLHKGFIPEGLQLDHLCHTWAVKAGTCAGGLSCPHRSCVNPDHLEPVTSAENTRRGDTVSSLNAAKTHCPQGHEYAGDNLYEAPNGDRLCRTCQRESGRLYMRRKREAQRAIA